MEAEEIRSMIHGWDSMLDSGFILPKDIVFEERVHLACFNCERYGINHTCPPNIPACDYQKIIGEYDHALLVWCSYPFTEETRSVARKESSLLLHRTLLRAEKVLWDQNAMVTSFTGGSCKLCETGCDAERCRQPSLSRIPLEAVGINVTKTCHKVGLEIIFPPIGHLRRVGLLLW